MADLKNTALVVLAVVALVAITAGVREYLDAREWRERVESVQAEAALQLENSRFLEREAARWEARAKELVVVADVSKARADSLAQRLARNTVVYRDRIDRIETPAGLEGHPAIVERDDLIEDLYADVTRWEAAYVDLDIAYDTLRVAFDASQARGDSLRAALVAATAAADSLNAVLDARPGQTPWWKPRIVVGPSAGLSGSGVPYAGVGVTVGWSIPTR